MKIEKKEFKILKCGHGGRMTSLARATIDHIVNNAMSFIAFDTPSSQHMQRMSPDEYQTHVRNVAESGRTLVNAPRLDNEPALSASIGNFLKWIYGVDTSDIMQDMLLRFILTNGTVYDPEHTPCRLIHDTPVDISALQLAPRNSLFIQDKTNLFGLIESGIFFPITGVFHIMHNGDTTLCESRDAACHKFSRVWHEPDRWDTHEINSEPYFSAGPFGRQRCVSSEALSNDCRSVIYNRYGRILDDRWLIFERWIDDNYNDRTLPTPIFFSETGQRFNYIMEPSRKSLREHLEQHPDITRETWERMLNEPVSGRNRNPLVYLWREKYLRRLISIEKFCDDSFSSCLFELTVTCPIDIGFEYRKTTGIEEMLKSKVITQSGSSLNVLKQINQIKQQCNHASGGKLSYGLHSKVISLNQLLKSDNDKFFGRKPKFCLELDTDSSREQAFDHDSSEYKESYLRFIKIEVKGFLKDLGYPFEEESFGPRTRDSRWQKIDIIMNLFETQWQQPEDVYDHFKEKSSPQRMDQIIISHETRDDVVIDDLGDIAFSDTDSEILRGLYLNLSFYMQTLPKLAYTNCSNQSDITYETTKIIWSKIIGYDYD